MRVVIFNSFSGFLRAELLSVKERNPWSKEAVVKLTETNGAYKKGEVLDFPISDIYLRHRYVDKGRTSIYSGRPDFSKYLNRKVVFIQKDKQV